MSGSAEWSIRRPSTISSRDPSVEEDEDPVRVRGSLRVVGDEDDRLAAGRCTTARATSRISAPVVKSRLPGGLVREEERGPRDERPRDRDPLLLAGRELVRAVALLARQVDERRSPSWTRSRSSPCAGSCPAIVNGEPDVLADVEQRDEVEELEDEARLLAAEPGRLVVGQRADVAALEDDVPVVGWSRPPSSWRSVLLPEPDGPMRATNSPGADRERDAPERIDGVVSRAGSAS